MEGRPSSEKIGEAVEESLKWDGQQPGILMNWVLTAEYLDPISGKPFYFSQHNDQITPATAVGLYQIGLDSVDGDDWEYDD